MLNSPNGSTTFLEPGDHSIPDSNSDSNGSYTSSESKYEFIPSLHLLYPGKIYRSDNPLPFLTLLFLGLVYLLHATLDCLSRLAKWIFQGSKQRRRRKRARSSLLPTQAPKGDRYYASYSTGSSFGSG
jgi:hypothetical protein